MSKSPLITISSPSGGGKSTVAQKILRSSRRFAKSISATTRAPRINEVEGRDYYFISLEEFKDKIIKDEFLEWEEVYPDIFYGTLNSEIDNIAKKRQIPILVIDVHGALELKKRLKDRLLTIFLDVPSIDVLRDRLQYRATESDEELKKRLARAEYELSFKNQFDIIIPNIQITNTVNQTIDAIYDFLHKFQS
ncbi:guanylate kinase [bacterium]|nr:guanylate kinase [Candidatus Elulimicrobium humile]